MKNPFIVGDQVYTAGNLEPWKVKEVGEGCVLLGSCPVPVKIEQLSFKPWPAPCHKRPIQDGWWVCTGIRSGEPYIRQVQGGSLVYYGKAYNLSQYNFHRYLGKDWK